MNAFYSLEKQEKTDWWFADIHDRQGASEQNKTPMALRLCNALVLYTLFSIQTTSPNLVKPKLLGCRWNIALTKMELLR